MIELSVNDVKHMIDYIHSCRSTKYNQEMTWDQMVAFDNIEKSIEELEE